MPPLSLYRREVQYRERPVEISVGPGRRHSRCRKCPPVGVDVLGGGGGSPG